jgi:translation elongation factor P/translation initiation factor 5A
MTVIFSNNDFIISLRIELYGDIFKIIEFHYVKPGKGELFIKILFKIFLISFFVIF